MSIFYPYIDMLILIACSANWKCRLRLY